MNVKSPKVVRNAGFAIVVAAVAGFVYGVLQNPKKSSDIVSPGIAVNGVDLSNLKAAAPADNATLADAGLKPKPAKKKVEEAAAADDNATDQPDVQPVSQPAAAQPSAPSSGNVTQGPY